MKSGSKRVLAFFFVVFLLVGAFCIYLGYDKMTNYTAGQVNAYVGGDAYNFIINANYSTAYYVLGGLSELIAFVCLAVSCLIGAIDRKATLDTTVPSEAPAAEPEAAPVVTETAVAEPVNEPAEEATEDAASPAPVEDFWAASENEAEEEKEEKKEKKHKKDKKDKKEKKDKKDKKHDEEEEEDAEESDESVVIFSSESDE